MHFIARHHLHATIYYIYLVEGGMTNIVIHIHRLGIAAYLRLGLFNGSVYFRLRGLALQIFKLDDIRVLHVGEHLATWAEEYVGIAVRLSSSEMGR